MHPEWIANGGTQLATTTYGYDNDGLLISRVRPAPNQSNPAVTVTTNYAYDPLHRILTRTYTNDPTSTMPARFAYDLSASGGVTLQNTIGRLAVSSVDNTAGNLFSYDEMGRVVKNWQCMVQLCATGSYLLQYSYDLVGNMLTASNGVGVTFSYSYNAGGRLTGMTSSLVDSTHPGTLLSAMHYGPYGPISDTVGTPANNLTESMQYNLYGRMKSYAVSKNGAAVYSFNIPDSGGFAPNWSVKSATDTVNGTWNYSYDQLDRLLSASRTSAPALTLNYAYDRYGNRWQQNSSPQYLFDNNNHIVGSGVVYDALGNVISDGIHAYAYDAENRVKSVDGGAAYGYDDAGRQLHTPNGEVLFNLAGRPWVFLSPYPQLIPSFEEIYGGGRHLGTYSGNTTNFIHSDWLGTKRLMTDINGNSSETAISQPFGDAFSFTQTDWNSMHFTDDAHDSISGLEHTWFRDYSTIQGRFTITDPDAGSMDLGNPQSLNRYAYVGNDPINYLDPIGLDGLGPGSGGAGGLWPANCTLFDGTPGEVFSCVGSLFGQNQFGAGGGFSFGILGPGFGGLGGGFGGVPLPGCFLPGACNVQLPSLSQQINQWLSGVLPNAGCNNGPVIVENCNPTQDLQGTAAAPVIGACAAEPELCAGAVIVVASVIIIANVPMPTLCTTGNCLDKWPWKNNDCDDQYEEDSAVCRKLHSRACWESAAERLAACYRGKPIPPLAR